jgi:hypothetical protein
MRDLRRGERERERSISNIAAYPFTRNTFHPKLVRFIQITKQALSLTLGVQHVYENLLTINVKSLLSSEEHILVLRERTFCEISSFHTKRSRDPIKKSHVLSKTQEGDSIFGGIFSAFF